MRSVLSESRAESRMALSGDAFEYGNSVAGLTADERGEVRQQQGSLVGDPKSERPARYSIPVQQ
jgi:hypothetical protein